MRMLTLAVMLALPTAAIASTPAPDTSPAAARRLVEAYYAAIESGDFRAAYRCWDNHGAASGKNFDAFRQGFAATAHSRVVTGTPINADAGMSQRWIEVPVDVYATLKNGRRQHFRGVYRLHRVVAGVGAPATDLAWRLNSAKLTAVP